MRCACARWGRSRTRCLRSGGSTAAACSRNLGGSMKALLSVTLVATLCACAAVPPEQASRLQSLAGTWKVHVDGVPQHKGQRSQPGVSYGFDFHYEFKADGSRIVATSVADSDDDVRLRLKGDRQAAGWFNVDGRRVRGKWYG